MINLIMNLPLWQIIRLMGIVSYLLLATGIGLGIFSGFALWSSAAKSRLLKLHSFTINAGLLFGLLHGAITVIDPYMPFTWREILVPFADQHYPLLDGLGTLAAYGALFLVFSSDFRHYFSKKMWHWIHLASYPIFLMATIHGFFLGTDTGSGMSWMYILSFGAILILSMIRLSLPAAAQKHNIAPEHNKFQSIDL